MPERTFKLVLAYDGAAYQGWQRQPDRPTVQQQVEAALLAVTGAAGPVHASGRTDAGVHALGQVAHFRTRATLAADALRRALNANLPDDIAVLAATEAAPDFHARYHARRKTYFYQFFIGAERHPLWRGRALHLRRLPDLARIRAAARHLEGRHDFRAFATRVCGGDGSDTVRVLQRLRVLETPHGFRIFATGDGFLRHMVRSLCGLLLRVGRGLETPEGAARILASARRTAAPAALPAHGLFLWKVDY